jgi:cytochrome c oxidase subunit 3
VSTQLEERPVVRGRRERPRDRLPVNETGLESQPVRFTPGFWAVILFVSSEVMFFGALFTTYFYLRARVPDWEPVFQRCIAAHCEKPAWNSQTEIFGITLPVVAINTILLVSSSFTMQFAVNAIKKGNRQGMIRWMIPTILLGAVFLTGQAYEYTKLGFLPTNGVFAAVFFTLTGFHGAHVTGGVLMNMYVTLRAAKGHFTANRHLAVEAASIYWHFVDVVWIGLFFTIYVIG